MIKKGSYLLGLTILVMLVSTGFNSLEIKKIEGFHLSEDEVYQYNFPSTDENIFEEQLGVNVPFVGKTFVGFREAIAFKESRGMLNLVNPYGYMGKYQFGRSTLRTLGIYDFNTFLQNSVWQEKAFKALIARNKWELRREIAKYSGRVINGVEITESGLLAAAHLGGAGSVKKYLRSNGRQGFKDGFGTSLRSYIKKFGGYDVSHIKADKNAKVKLG